MNDEDVRNTGPCKACLSEDVLDNHGYCLTCRPADPEMLRVLNNLLNKPKEEATA